MDVGVRVSRKITAEDLIGKRVRTTTEDGVVVGTLFKFDKYSELYTLKNVSVNGLLQLDYVFSKQDIVKDAKTNKKHIRIFTPKTKKGPQSTSNKNHSEDDSNTTSSTSSQPESSKERPEEVAAEEPVVAEDPQADPNEEMDPEDVAFFESLAMPPTIKEQMRNDHVEKGAVGEFQKEDLINALWTANTDDDFNDKTTADHEFEDEIRRSLEEDVPPLPSPDFDCEVFIFESENDVINGVSFHEALIVISQQSQIGLDVFSETKSRNSTIDVIGISCYRHGPSIFAFVVAKDRTASQNEEGTYSRMARRLKEVLMNPEVEKICVGLDEISDIMKHRMGIELIDEGEAMDVAALDRIILQRDNKRKNEKSSSHRIIPFIGERSLEDIILHRMKQKVVGQGFVERFSEIEEAQYFKNFKSDFEYKVLLEDKTTNAAANFLKRKLLFLMPLYHDLTRMYLKDYIVVNKAKIHGKRDLSDAELKQKLQDEALGKKSHVQVNIDELTTKKDIEDIRKACQIAKPIDSELLSESSRSNGHALLEEEPSYDIFPPTKAVNTKKSKPKKLPFGFETSMQDLTQEEKVQNYLDETSFHHPMNDTACFSSSQCSGLFSISDLESVIISHASGIIGPIPAGHKFFNAQNLNSHFEKTQAKRLGCL